MDQPQDPHATSSATHPVTGSCPRCSCALSHFSSLQGEAWYCCGACAGSDRCTCGCRPELVRDAGTDRYVPTRRMFGARPPDELRRPAEFRSLRRAFPFADRRRGK